MIIEAGAPSARARKAGEEATAPIRAKSAEHALAGGPELVTRSGVRLQVRPAGPGDEPLLAEFFRHVSPEDLRFRFLAGIREVSHERLLAMTRVDHETTENFLAFADGGDKVVATAMIARDGSGRKAEVAISVRADYKQKGVAWELLRYVSRYASERGIRVLESIESRENHEAVELEREQGFIATTFEEDPTLMLIRKELSVS